MSYRITEQYKRVLIAASEVQAIEVIDCGEPLVDMQDSGLVIDKKTPPTKSKRILVRESIKKKLLEAKLLLPTGLKLRVHEGYISLKLQQKDFDTKFAIVQQTSPHLSFREIFIETTKLASPVKNMDGTVNIPPHSTGAAVDVEILNHQDESLDFGVAIEDWATANPLCCELRCESLSVEAKKNRKLLYDIMTQVGFVNYFTEWWHFSYGDKYWAFQLNRENAIYGCCDKTEGQ
ncbi:hypothetical protein TI03_02045 [Achromatium sp. WMS1]|nr:hypothetical protein TI03_02045 [Achromatium sp. WMS1]